MLKGTDRCQQVLISEASISASLTPQLERMLQVWVCTWVQGTRVAGMGLHVGLGYACCDYGSAYLQIDLSLSQLLQQRPRSCNGTSQTVSPIAASQLVGLLICTIWLCAASSGGHLSMSRSLMPLKAVAEVLAGGVQQPVMSPETSESGTKVLSQQAHLSWQACVRASQLMLLFGKMMHCCTLTKLHCNGDCLKAVVSILLYFWRGHQFLAPFPDLRKKKLRKKVNLTKSRMVDKQKQLAFQDFANAAPALADICHAAYIH